MTKKTIAINTRTINNYKYNNNICGNTITINSLRTQSFEKKLRTVQIDSEKETGSEGPFDSEE